MKDIKNLYEQEKQKRDNMVLNVTKISQKIEKNKLVEYRKKYYKMRKNVLLLS